MIRGQARFLGKPVRASERPNGSAFLRKRTEMDEISQANAWNDSPNIA
jgi:hypothetical protein